jgi:hypothetical protein
MLSWWPLGGSGEVATSPPRVGTTEPVLTSPAQARSPSAKTVPPLQLSRVVGSQEIFMSAQSKRDAITSTTVKGVDDATWTVYISSEDDIDKLTDLCLERTSLPASISRMFIHRMLASKQANALASPRLKAYGSSPLPASIESSGSKRIAGGHNGSDSLLSIDVSNSKTPPRGRPDKDSQLQYQRITSPTALFGYKSPINPFAASLNPQKTAMDRINLSVSSTDTPITDVTTISPGFSAHTNLQCEHVYTVNFDDEVDAEMSLELDAGISAESFEDDSLVGGGIDFNNTQFTLQRYRHCFVRGTSLPMDIYVSHTSLQNPLFIVNIVSTRHVCGNSRLFVGLHDDVRDVADQFVKERSLPAAVAHPVMQYLSDRSQELLTSFRLVNTCTKIDRSLNLSGGVLNEESSHVLGSNDDFPAYISYTGEMDSGSEVNSGCTNMDSEQPVEPLVTADDAASSICFDDFKHHFNSWFNVDEEDVLAISSNYDADDADESAGNDSTNLWNPQETNCLNCLEAAGIHETCAGMQSEQDYRSGSVVDDVPQPASVPSPNSTGVDACPNIVYGENNPVNTPHSSSKRRRYRYRGVHKMIAAPTPVDTQAKHQFTSTFNFPLANALSKNGFVNTIQKNLKRLRLGHFSSSDSQNDGASDTSWESFDSKAAFLEPSSPDRPTPCVVELGPYDKLFGDLAPAASSNAGRVVLDNVQSKVPVPEDNSNDPPSANIDIYLSEESRNDPITVVEIPSHRRDQGVKKKQMLRVFIGENDDCMYLCEKYIHARNLSKYFIPGILCEFLNRKAEAILAKQQLERQATTSTVTDDNEVVDYSNNNHVAQLRYQSLEPILGTLHLNHGGQQASSVPAEERLAEILDIVVRIDKHCVRLRLSTADIDDSTGKLKDNVVEIVSALSELCRMNDAFCEMLRSVVTSEIQDRKEFTERLLYLRSASESVGSGCVPAVTPCNTALSPNSTHPSENCPVDIYLDEHSRACPLVIVELRNPLRNGGKLVGYSPNGQLNVAVRVYVGAADSCLDLSRRVVTTLGVPADPFLGAIVNILSSEKIKKIKSVDVLQHLRSEYFSCDWLCRKRSYSSIFGVADYEKYHQRASSFDAEKVVEEQSQAEHVEEDDDGHSTGSSDFEAAVQHIDSSNALKPTEIFLSENSRTHPAIIFAISEKQVSTIATGDEDTASADMDETCRIYVGHEDDCNELASMFLRSRGELNPVYQPRLAALLRAQLHANTQIIYNDYYLTEASLHDSVVCVAVKETDNSISRIYVGSRSVDGGEASGGSADPDCLRISALYVNSHKLPERYVLPMSRYIRGKLEEQLAVVAHESSSPPPSPAPIQGGPIDVVPVEEQGKVPPATLKMERAIYLSRLSKENPLVVVDIEEPVDATTNIQTSSHIYIGDDDDCEQLASYYLQLVKKMPKKFVKPMTAYFAAKKNEARRRNGVTSS